MSKTTSTAMSTPGSTARSATLNSGVTSSPADARPGWGRLWEFARPVRAQLALALMISGLIGLLMLTPSIYMLQIYDRVMASGNQVTLLAVSLLALASLAAVAALELSRAAALLRASRRLDACYREPALRAAFIASLEPAGQDSAARALPDLAVLRQFLCGPGLIVWFELPWVPLYLGVLYLLHPWLAGMACAIVAVQALLTAWGQRTQTDLQSDAADATHRELALVRGTMRAAECVAILGMLPALQRHWLSRRDARERVATEAASRGQLATATGRWVRQLQQSLMLGLSAWLVVRGELTAGSMIAATMLCARALSPIDGLLTHWAVNAAARDALGRLDALGRRGAEVQDGAAPTPHETRPNAVTLRGINAFVPGRAEPILQGIDMQLAPGSLTALVGPSGAGKSTLARVLVNTWPGITGEAWLGDRPLDVALAAGDGAGVGYLPQELHLFDGSVAANIARLQAGDPAAVIEAARAVGAHEAILRLPQGYDTPVSDPRQPLNAGLLQRIGLARAVYRSPQLLVLDEPDAHLDEDGERLLHELLGRLRDTGHTIVVVSHRPGTLRLADRVAVLERGRLRLQGRAALAGPRHGQHVPLPT